MEKNIVAQPTLCLIPREAYWHVCPRTSRAACQAHCVKWSDSGANLPLWGGWYTFDGVPGWWLQWGGYPETCAVLCQSDILPRWYRACMWKAKQWPMSPWWGNILPPDLLNPYLPSMIIGLPTVWTIHSFILTPKFITRRAILLFDVWPVVWTLWCPICETLMCVNTMLVSSGVPVCGREENWYYLTGVFEYPLPIPIVNGEASGLGSYSPLPCQQKNYNRHAMPVTFDGGKCTYVEEWKPAEYSGEQWVSKPIPPSDDCYYLLLWALEHYYVAIIDEIGSDWYQCVGSATRQTWRMWLKHDVGRHGVAKLPNTDSSQPQDDMTSKPQPWYLMVGDVGHLVTVSLLDLYSVCCIDDVYPIVFSVPPIPSVCVGGVPHILGSFPSSPSGKPGGGLQWCPWLWNRWWGRQSRRRKRRVSCCGCGSLLEYCLGEHAQVQCPFLVRLVVTSGWWPCVWCDLMMVGKTLTVCGNDFVPVSILPQSNLHPLTLPFTYSSSLVWKWHDGCDMCRWQLVGELCPRAMPTSDSWKFWRKPVSVMMWLCLVEAVDSVVGAGVHGKTTMRWRALMVDLSLSHACVALVTGCVSCVMTWVTCVCVTCHYSIIPVCALMTCVPIPNLPYCGIIFNLLLERLQFGDILAVLMTWVVSVLSQTLWTLSHPPDGQEEAVCGKALCGSSDVCAVEQADSLWRSGRGCVPSGKHWADIVWWPVACHLSLLTSPSHISHM